MTLYTKITDALSKRAGIEDANLKFRNLFYDKYAGKMTIIFTTDKEDILIV